MKLVNVQVWVHLLGDLLECSTEERYSNHGHMRGDSTLFTFDHEHGRGLGPVQTVGGDSSRTYI